ncbi:hypothetical protein OKA04_23475 [Luteolibacter flavescens]|uniref:Uncharacterized protein n=1 Tax=Luteolibacter flavescens TaxID=1859460 RepID=A0ABT3FVV4_9BACT|nr:hypothetical protein [Luteolibacter flavescens]MCW1887718.1 hypothetical protein [Luteolibacter flavescens]
MVPDPPVSIDLGAGGSGPWPAFTLAGVTGTHAAALNVAYTLAPYNGSAWRYAGAGTAEVIQTSPGNWAIRTSATNRFTGAGLWPWDVATWTAAGGGAGTPALTRTQAAPVDLDLAGASTTTFAVMETNLSGTNDDLSFTSKLPGRLGNDVRVRYQHPNLSNQSTAVQVEGRDITVLLATDGSAVITSTATQVKAAIDGHAEASKLVTVANKAGNTGAGLVQTMAFTALAGGTGGLPLPPETIAL